MSSSNCERREAAPPHALTQCLTPQFIIALKFVLLFFVSLILVLLAQSPVDVFMPSSGLDASWTMVSNFAAEHGENFGRDIIFSVGPLGFLYGRFFSVPLLVYKIFFDCLFAVTFSLMLARMSSSTGLLRAIFLIVCLFLSLQLNRDVCFLAFIFVFASAALWADRRGADLDLIAAAAVIGAIILVKLSFAFLALPAVLLSDWHYLRRRRLPIFTAVMLIAAISCFMRFSNIEYVGEFLRGTYEIIAGYGDAASFEGPIGEIVLYLCACLALVALMRSAQVSNPPLEVRLYWAFLIWAMFVAFKAGFVRHDLHHSLTAWTFLANCAVISLLLPSTVAKSRLLELAKLMIVPVLIAASLVVYRIHSGVPARQIAVQRFIDMPVARFSEMRSAIAHPSQWSDGKIQMWAGTVEAIRKTTSLPTVEGSVDIIPSQQAEVLALGLNYHHRPVFQEYLAYTPHLIDMNRSFFEGPDAPSALLMRPGSIDNRWPASADGSLWPLFFARYEPLAEAGRLIVLRLRDHAAQPHIERIGGEQTTFEKRVLVPREHRPLLVQIKVRPTYLGQLVGLAFKRSHVTIRATLRNGRITEQRLIPAMAQAGFLLSPYVETAREYGAVAAGLASELASKQVAEIEIRTSSFGRMQYAREIGLSYFALADIPSAPSAFHVHILERYRYLSELLKGQRMEPSLGLIDDRLFAHPPRELTLGNIAGERLKFSYGIFDGAWATNDPTDGVCFRIEALDKAHERVPVWESCLDPTHNVRDREPQSAQVKLDAEWNALVFATLCRRSCASDWSYWSDIAIDP
jgi:hypothetical protein